MLTFRQSLGVRPIWECPRCGMSHVARFSKEHTHPGWSPRLYCNTEPVERTYIAVDALRQFGDGLFPPSREAIRSAIEALTDGS